MSILGAIGGIAGSVLGGIFGNKQADEQAQLQREFAQNGIRWKVEDAKQAGIHPLYALGAQTTAYSPISVGSPDFATGGQNLGSAIQAMTTPKEKLDGFAKTVQGLTLEKMGLENEVLRSQLRVVNQPGRGPGMPGATMIDGQGDATKTMTVDGIRLNVNPNNTPAEDAEAQYGEIGGELFGIGNLVSDVLKQVTGSSGPRELGRDLAAALKKAIAEEAKKKPTRDPIFNENFYGDFKSWP